MKNRRLSALFIAVLFCSILLISLHSHRTDIEACHSCAICKCADALSAADKAPPDLLIALYLMPIALVIASLIRAMRVPTVAVISRAPPLCPCPCTCMSLS